MSLYFREKSIPLFTTRYENLGDLVFLAPEGLNTERSQFRNPSEARKMSYYDIKEEFLRLAKPKLIIISKFLS